MPSNYIEYTPTLKGSADSLRARHSEPLALGPYGAALTRRLAGITSGKGGKKTRQPTETPNCPPAAILCRLTAARRPLDCSIFVTCNVRFIYREVRVCSVSAVQLHQICRNSFFFACLALRPPCTQALMMLRPCNLTSSQAL